VPSALRLRRPAVAGSFYPGEAGTLASLVDHLLADASASRTNLYTPVPKALIVPHAGYMYSGAIAASGYARLGAAAGRIARVVLIGPAHRVWFEGLALPDADRLETPLGIVRAGSVDLPGVLASAPAHAEEHSLEVHLPFLQRVLGDVEVIPLLTGDASAERVAVVLDGLWGGDETVVIVSSDLSHYHAWDDAVGRDARSAAQIEALGPALSHDQACGATAVNGLLLSAKRRGLRVECLDLRNSGDTAGSRDRVVGYGAFAFYEPTGRT
jgi:MEMO1 family protein